MRDIPTLVVSAAKAGHINQCLAFCEQMGWPVTEQIAVPGPSRMNSGWRNRWLRFRRWRVLREVLPRARIAGRIRIVASGTSSEPATALYRRLYGRDLYAVCIGSPRAREPIFDFAIAANHALEHGAVSTPTFYRGAKITTWMPGVLVKPLPTGGQTEQGPVLALIGGTNKAFYLSADALLGQLQAIARQANQMVVVFSRRTPPDLEARIRAGLHGATFVDRQDRPGFLKAAAEAARFAVTPDSITMTCEAFATGKPVTLLDLPCFDRNTSTYRFYAELRALDGEAGAVLHRAVEHAIAEARKDFQGWLAA